MIGWLALLSAFLLALGVGAWVVEGPVGKAIQRRRNRPETIADRQSTSERGIR